MDISVIILTKDETLHLGRCLDKLRPLEPRGVFVVDSCSTDGTQEIARAHRATVIEHKWPGLHSVQFNWALKNCPIRTEWVLRLDADEYFLDEAIDSIKKNLPGLPSEVCGVVFARRTIFCGRWVKRGTYPVKLLRLFRRDAAICEERHMDEHIQLLRGQSVEFAGDFVDHNLNSLEWWKNKHRGYAKREALDAIDMMNEVRNPHGRQINIDGQAAEKRAKKYRYYRLPPYFRAVLYFCWRYFVKGGFLEGRAGFMWNVWQGLWYRCLVDKEILRIEWEAMNDMIDQDAIEESRIMHEPWDEVAEDRCNGTL